MTRRPLLFVPYLFLALVRAQPPNLSISPEANYIAIDGWWTQCGSRNDALNDRGCKGDIQSVGPAPIDVNGTACYINPRTRNIGVGVEHMIYWFRAGESTGSVTIYSWYIPFADVPSYFPTECTEGGACKCNAAFEELRAGWNTSANSENPCKGTEAVETPDSHDCKAISFQPLESYLKETECAVSPFFSITYMETVTLTDMSGNVTYTINACAIPARFASYAPTISPMPTSMPSSDSSFGNRNVEFLLHASIIALLMVFFGTRF